MEHAYNPPIAANQVFLGGTDYSGIAGSELTRVIVAPLLKPKGDSQ